MLYGTAYRNRTHIRTLEECCILHYTKAVNWWKTEESNLNPCESFCFRNSPEPNSDNLPCMTVSGRFEPKLIPSCN